MTAAEDRDLTSNVKLRSEKIKVKKILIFIQIEEIKDRIVLSELEFLKLVGEENVGALKKVLI